MESNKNKEKFKAALDGTIEAKYMEIMLKKSDSERYLTYFDAQVITSSIKNIFKHSLDMVPKEIDQSCELSLAILAPSTEEKKMHLKNAYALVGGIAGTGMIIAGIATGLGWGAGVIASVSAFFVGSAVLGPAGWIISGAAALMIVGYFTLQNDKEKNTEIFIKSLKNSITNSIDLIWDKYGDKLSEVSVNKN
mgnify:CR=1 FL=1